MYRSFYVKYPYFFSDFNETLIFSTEFRIKFKYQISSKSAQWELSRSMQAHRRTARQTKGWAERQTDITKLIVVFCNFKTAPRKLSIM
jgi:hypothetical protein